MAIPNWSGVLLLGEPSTTIEATRTRYFLASRQLPPNHIPVALCPYGRPSITLHPSQPHNKYRAGWPDPSRVCDQCAWSADPACVVCLCFSKPASAREL